MKAILSSISSNKIAEREDQRAIKIMKRVLLLLGLLVVLLHDQADAKRVLMEEAAPAPTIGAKRDTENSSYSDEEEKNNSYGSYGNPSGSTTKNHHYYISDKPPAKEH
ncbi:hypothetical protein Gotri_019525 [Gossypium trilobum]|uniref:Uncharacterized protein n=2 Tax=Gossypium TaxID=3633 RepID=A0A7J9EDU0_9ROSI|nr:hypothetical protein [Gossypium trilobum]